MIKAGQAEMKSFSVVFHSYLFPLIYMYDFIFKSHWLHSFSKPIGDTYTTKYSTINMTCVRFLSASGHPNPHLALPTPPISWRTRHTWCLICCMLQRHVYCQVMIAHRGEGVACSHIIKVSHCDGKWQLCSLDRGPAVVTCHMRRKRRLWRNVWEGWMKLSFPQ